MFDGQTEIHQLKKMHIATSAFRSHKNDKYSDISDIWPDIHYSGHCHNSLRFYQIHQIVATKFHANPFIDLTIL